ncbi:M16 family metallopeptidase [Thioalkalivibrio paradoxus]|uniref:Zinc protease n=1 Tax=Thioalkalivibrio paradoxus ARh 1 TaxID=713585 RepID=W0DQT7_9GAMM|nr:pitrilysin family protein [Thioalkalivibrio paradoxus]AHE99617.1 zinc protease [Thioalkalivibrio paradoxus ARh 1]
MSRRTWIAAPATGRCLRWPGLGLFAAFALWFAPALQAVEIERWDAAGGMRVLYAPAAGLPMVDVRLTFDAGAARDGDRHGLARLTNEALTYGTEAMDADALAERFESVGARFSTSAARDMGIVSLRTLTEPDWMAEAIDTLTELLAAPAFPEDDLARGRRQLLQALQRERQEPGSVASRRFYQLMYPGHPYANPTLGDEATLPTLTRDEVDAFFRQYYTAGNAVLALTGAISRDEAEALADRIAAALPQGERAPELPPVPQLEGPVTERIGFPSEQAHIFIGAPALRRDDPDYYALTVANHVLGGGGFTSRLFDEVRTRRGLAYSVYSAYRPMAAEGPFLIGMQTGRDQTDEAIEVLREELLRYHRDGVTPDELEASQANITGSFPLRLASNSDIVQNLGMLGFYDLPLDYLSGHNERIDAVTVDDVHQALQRRLRPDALVTVVVGGED